jgi:hypothetical protein
MKAWAFLAAGPALAACFDKPPFRGVTDDCPDDGSLSVHLESGRPVVCGDGYRLQFSDRGYGLPDSFAIHGVEIAAGGDSCDDGGAFAIGLLPAGVIDGADPANPAQTITGGRRVAIELATPFVVKVGIDWSARFGTCPLAPTGRTTFTFFRGGRVHRFDHLADDSTALASACAPACAEAARTSWDLSTITTLVAPADRAVTHVPTPPDDDRGDGVAFMRHELCVDDAAYTLALHWSEFEQRRLRVPASGQIAFVQELLSTEETKLPGGFERRMHSALVIGEPGEDCATAERRAASYYDSDPQLVINGSPTGASHDGIYGGERDDGSTGRQIGELDAVLSLGGGSPTIPTGAVVWLDFIQRYSAFDVSKAGGDSSGTWYELYPVPETAEVLLWLRDPIAAGETITIHPHD